VDSGELRSAVDAGAIDTVVVAMTDMQGRLQGKRLHAQFFLDEVAAHGTEACNYLLAVDTDMNTVDGYAMSSWEDGYGDFVLAPDMTTLRAIPWQPGTALVLADVLAVADRTPIAPSPRQILKAQLERVADYGWTCYAGTELEFIIFEGSYEQAWDGGYRGLVPANRYNVDYSVLGTSRVEPLLRDIRNGMASAGLRVESAKGECNPGQHEIAFRYADALTTADQHVLYKTGAKEIAARHGYSLTFMAKVNEREGNSCHIHVSFRAGDGTPVMAGDGRYGLSETGAAVVAGMQAGLRADDQLLQEILCRQLRTDRGGVGAGQPDLCAATDRARALAAGGVPSARRRREPVPGPGRLGGGRAGRRVTKAAVATAGDR
jgi:glutamine synthetase